MCASLNFTPYPDLLLWGHIGIFYIRVLWLFLPTWVSIWSPVANGSYVLPVSCTSGTFPGSGILEISFMLASAEWTGVHGILLHWCSFSHCRSHREKSFSFLSQLLEGRLLVSRMSSILTRYRSPMFAFLHFPFIVLSSRPLWNVKKCIMWKPVSHFGPKWRECLLMYTRSLTLN